MRHDDQAFNVGEKFREERKVAAVGVGKIQNGVEIEPVRTTKACAQLLGGVLDDLPGNEPVI